MVELSSAGETWVCVIVLISFGAWLGWSFRPSDEATIRKDERKKTMRECFKGSKSGTE